MRKIKIKEWKGRQPVFDSEGKPTGKIEEIDESLLSALNVLIMNKKPEDMPRGLDQFRTMNRLAKAFDKAKESGTLELEEVDYMFLKKTIEGEVPSVWGSNPNIFEAIETFLEAKTEGK